MRALSGCAARAFLEGFIRGLTRGVEDRRQPKQDARRERHHRREHQHRKIHARAGDPWEAGSAEAYEQAQRPVSQRQPGQTAGHAEDEALDEQLARQPPSARAERLARGDFALPSGSMHQQQIGYIGAGDQEHQANRCHQHPKRCLDVADLLFEQGNRDNGEVEIAVRIIGVLLDDALRESCHFCAGSLETQARPDPRNDMQPMIAAGVLAQVRKTRAGSTRRPRPGIGTIGEARRRSDSSPRS